MPFRKKEGIRIRLRDHQKPYPECDFAWFNPKGLFSMRKILTNKGEVPAALLVPEGSTLVPDPGDDPFVLVSEAFKMWLDAEWRHGVRIGMIMGTPVIPVPHLIGNFVLVGSRGTSVDFLSHVKWMYENQPPEPEPTLSRRRRLLHRILTWKRQR